MKMKKGKRTVVRNLMQEFGNTNLGERNQHGWVASGDEMR